MEAAWLILRGQKSTEAVHVDIISGDESQGNVTLEISTEEAIKDITDVSA